MVSIIIEVIAWLATVILATLWITDPAGNYEPWTVICGVLAASAEWYRQFKTRSVNESLPVSKPQELIRWIQDHGMGKPMSQVLPRALQLAQLLGHQQLEHWVRMELYGYTKEGGMTDTDVVPEYREITGRYMDEYNRILQIEDPKLHFINGYRLRFGARQLEELAVKEEMQNLRDEDLIEILRRELNIDVFRFCFSPTEIVGVLDRIRNRLLEKINCIELDQKDVESVS